MIWWILGIGIGVLLAAEAILNAFSVRIILPIFERVPLLNPRVSPPDDQAELLEIPTTGGATLSGCLYRRSETESRGIVIFCPEFGSSKWSCKSYCEGLWDAGYDLLAFDFRNSGDSSWQDDYHPLHWVSEFELQDVRAAIEYVRRRDDLKERPIGLFGVSRGGGAALAAGAESPDVELIATDSAFATEPMMMFFTRRWISLYIPEWLNWLIPTWHVMITMQIVRMVSQRRHGCRYARIIQKLKRIAPQKRVLLVSGEADTFVSQQIAEELARAAGRSLQELWIVPGCKHNAARQLEPEEYDERVTEFFAGMSPLRGESAKEATVHGAS